MSGTMTKTKTIQMAKMPKTSKIIIIMMKKKMMKVIMIIIIQSIKRC